MPQRPGAARSAFARWAIRLAAAAALAACSLSPYKFAGGGLPRHIRTIAVVPFQNETSSPDLQRELFERMRRDVQGRLNLRDAPESRADAIVRGTIVRYDVDVPIAYSSDPNQAKTARRQLQLVVDVTIVDQTNGRTLWERKGLAAKGEYPETSESEGRRQAIEEIINDIIEGTQSQW